MLASVSGRIRGLEGRALDGWGLAQEGVNLITQPIVGGLMKMPWPHSGAEVTQMEQQVEQLTAEVVRLREAELENEWLRSLFQYKAVDPEQAVIARVIGRDTTNLAQSLVINRGSDDGIQPGMVIVAQGALVGHITRVAPRYSTVLLITDPRSSVNGMVQHSRALGVVSGRGEGRLTLDYVGGTEEVSSGDAVITSGLGGGFPQGIFIGQVTQVTREPYQMFPQIEVKPALDLSRMELAQVLTDFLPIEVER